jgi:23S rRNA (pseudouridine1915-N3)-methyltransferase
MKWNLLTIGKPSLEFARLGAAEYRRRLEKQTDFAWQVVKAMPATKPAGQFWLVLDERGTQLSTVELRQKVDVWELAAVKHITVLIGGADGHSEATRQQADYVLGLSALTLQHELALVVFLEALYRVYTLKRGEPYHR